MYKNWGKFCQRRREGGTSSETKSRKPRKEKSGPTLFSLWKWYIEKCREQGIEPVIKNMPDGLRRAFLKRNIL